MKDLNSFNIKLDKFSNEFINNVMEAQHETAEIICEDAKRLAPKQTGEYANSIKVGETTYDGHKIRTEIYTDAIVTSKRDGDVYNLGFLLETGTSPHLIVPIDAKVLHFVIDGKDIFTKIVYHPGTVAQPHFIPALNMNKLVYKQKLNEAFRRSFNE